MDFERDLWDETQATAPQSDPFADLVPRWLALYLLVTGALGGLAVSVPGLVLIGYILLIIPGLILSFSPTAFLWGMFFAFAYVPARRLLWEPVALMIGCAFAALIIYMAPQMSVADARATLERYHLDDVALRAPIKPTGDIRLELFGNFGVDSKYAFQNALSHQNVIPCDTYCVALLFSPGVTSVTVNVPDDARFDQLATGSVPLKPAARTWRLLPRGQCGDGGVYPNFNRVGAFGASTEDNKALDDLWRAKLSHDVCLTFGPAVPHADLVIRSADWHGDGNDRMTGDLAEIRDGKGLVLMRRWRITTSALSAPLACVTNPLDKQRDCWFRQVIGNHQQTMLDSPVDSTLSALDKALDVPRHAAADGALASLRNALWQAARDPAVKPDAPVFDTTGHYIDLLAKTSPGPQDIALISALITDPRPIELKGAASLGKAFPVAQLVAWRRPIARKLATFPLDVVRDGTALGWAPKTWPEGVFSRPQADEDRLIADPARQWLVVGAIERLSDRGPSAAAVLGPMLASHIRAERALDSYSGPNIERERHQQVIYSATVALCRIGSGAHGQLAALLAVEPLVNRFGSTGALWDMMMARIGKPLAKFTVPSGVGWYVEGTPEQYRANLNSRLQNYRPDRDCN